eukprot:8599204-Lingulodinium_polyedra.AAC.2
MAQSADVAHGLMHCVFVGPPFAQHRIGHEQLGAAILGEQHCQFRRGRALPQETIIHTDFGNVSSSIVVVTMREAVHAASDAMWAPGAERHVGKVVELPFFRRRLAWLTGFPGGRSLFNLWFFSAVNPVHKDLRRRRSLIGHRSPHWEQVLVCKVV